MTYLNTIQIKASNYKSNIFFHLCFKFYIRQNFKVLSCLEIVNIKLFLLIYVNFNFTLAKVVWFSLLNYISCTMIIISWIALITISPSSLFCQLE